MTEPISTPSTAVIPRARLTITRLAASFSETAFPDVEEIRTDVEFIAEFDYDLAVHFDDADPTDYSVKMWVPANSWLCLGRPHVKVKGYTETQVFAFPHLELDRIIGTEYTGASPPMSHVIWKAHKDRQGNVFAVRNPLTGVVGTHG